MRNPEGGAPPPEASDLTPEQEKAIVSRMIEHQERMIAATQKWLERAEKPISEHAVVGHVAEVGAKWETFVMDLVGIRKEIRDRLLGLDRRRKESDDPEKHG